VFGGLSSTLLPSVLSLEQKLWWSLIAAMSHELTAAGCVLASIAHDRDRDRNRGGEGGLSEDDLLLKLTIERNELEDKVKDLELELERERERERERAKQAEIKERLSAGDVTSAQQIILDELIREERRRALEPELLSTAHYPLPVASTLALSPDASLPQPSPYPFPCLRCGGTVTSPADAFNHSNCGD